MAIFVQTWAGGTIKIIDATNAGKRGKSCDVVWANLWRTCFGEPGGPEQASAAFAGQSIAWADALPPDSDFSVVAAELEKKVADASLPESHASAFRETIRGVDAPKPVLVAHVDGQWGGSVDERGVHVSDLTDLHNEPRLITGSKQSNNEAYRLAAKVWDKVKQAKTFGEAWGILTEAGCKLHYYCALD